MATPVTSPDLTGYFPRLNESAAMAAAVGAPFLMPGQLRAQAPAPRIREVRAFQHKSRGRTSINLVAEVEWR